MKFLLMLLALPSVGIVIGCASSPKRYTLHELYSREIKVRRPPYVAADPKVGPGGVDFKTSPDSSRDFACMPMSELLTKTNLSSVGTCLQSIKDTYSAKYILRHETQPFFELKAEDKTPVCLKESLASIAVPREMFFRAPHKEKVECFNARIESSPKKILGIKVPSSKEALVIDFPLLEPPQNEQQVSRMLFSWILTPFF